MRQQIRHFVAAQSNSEQVPARQPLQRSPAASPRFPVRSVQPRPATLFLARRCSIRDTPISSPAQALFHTLSAQAGTCARPFVRTYVLQNASKHNSSYRCYPFLFVAIQLFIWYLEYTMLLAYNNREELCSQHVSI